METSLLPGDGLREAPGGEEDLRRSGGVWRKLRSGDPDVSHVPQMSDRGGGVPLRKIERLFSYMYSTAPTPQPGTGGTPLVRWLLSGSPHWPPEGCLLAFGSLIKLSFLPISRFPTSHGPSVLVWLCVSLSLGLPALPVFPSLYLPTYLRVSSVCHCCSTLPSPLSLHK